MNKKSYSQILDAVAGDHIPNDLDLAPTIIAKIQKGKGIGMHPKTKLVSEILLIAIAFAVLFYTTPAVKAAFERWFGYVPGVGLVREGQIRVLAEPASVTREGITVTVDQVVLNQEGAALVYSVEGIPSGAETTQPGEKRCPYTVTLRLPDGSPLLATPNGVQGWASGYQHRFNYPPVPAAINDAKLVISCLFNTRAGAAPEDWEIPLRFVPAPPDVTAFPVIEIPTPTAPAVTATSAVPAGLALPATPAVSAAEGTATDIAPAAAEISLTLDRAVQMDDGYLLYATLHWEDAHFSTADVIDAAQTLHLLDASGQEMIYETLYDEQTGVFVDQRQTVFAIKTAPVQIPGPLTLVLDSVLVELPVKASFVFDPGQNPEAGQQWQPDQEVAIGERRLRVRSVIADVSGYSFEMTSDTGILNATCADFEHPIRSGSGGGGSNEASNFGCSFNYAEGLPTGPVTVSIGSIGVNHIQKLQAQWTPPAVSTTQLPAQPAACLTTETWQSSLSQPQVIPTGLPGKVLVYSQVDSNDPNSAWEVAITNLDGSQRQTIAGATDGAISPDGTKLAYSAVLDAGISIKDLASGETYPVPGTKIGDFNPFWSPDGKRIVFNRGMGIFDLFVVNLDGSDLRQLTFGGVQEFPGGWLAGGSLLYTVPGRDNEYTTYQVDLQSGKSQAFSSDNIQSASPDGRSIMTDERTFGDRWQVWISDSDGSNRRALTDGKLWFLSPHWSPDGQWILAGISSTGSGSTVGALVNPRTCQVIALPDLKGSILSWAP